MIEDIIQPMAACETVYSETQVYCIRNSPYSCRSMDLFLPALSQLGLALLVSFGSLLSSANPVFVVFF